MFFSTLDVLNVILLPLVIAIVLLVVVYLLATSRRDKPRPPAPRQPDEPPARAESAGPGPSTQAAPRPAKVEPVPAAVQPAAAAAAAATSPPPAAAVDADADADRPPRPLTADLLLVDDSAVVRTMLRRLFTANGYTVDLAKDGLEALGRLRQGRYAMLITDLEMPHMDGIELISALADDPLLQRLPVLAITGHENLQERLGACQGLTGIHRKPWNDDDLLDHVRMVVRTRAADLSLEPPA